jgi:hypothetical protein
MTDSSNALQLFQEALLRGEIRLQRGTLDPNLYLHVDHPDGETRFTYVTLEDKTVTALVNSTLCDPVERSPCFSIGYAVPEGYRGQGRAKEIINAGIVEMKHSLGRYGQFYVEAVVGAENKPSQRVAEKTISDTPVAITEKLSGLPAFRYIRKIEQAKVSSV